MVSIIIPNYNHAPFLKKRLDSIFNQTYRDFEVILLDDASTDHSLAVLEEYAVHPEVTHYVVNDQNSGSPFAQWEKGIRLAKGDFIWIAESDDYNAPDFISKMVPLFENARVGLALSSLYWVDEKGIEIEDKTVYKDSFLHNGREEVKEHLSKYNTIQNVSSVLFRKDVFDKINLNDFVGFKSCGDWMLYVQVLQDWDLTFYNEKLTYFRRHKSSTSILGNPMDTWTLEGLELFRLFDLKELAYNSIGQRRLIAYWTQRVAELEGRLVRMSALLRLIRFVPSRVVTILFSYFTVTGRLKK